MILASYAKFRPDIAVLLDPRFYSIEWLDQGIAGGSATVFGNDDACIVVELKRYPAGGVEVHGLVAAGDVLTIFQLIDRAEEWGREQGAIVAAVASREAWVRLLAPRGYRPHQITLRKELCDGA